MTTDAEGPPRKRPRLTTVVSLRLPPDVADSWRAAATGAGVSFSDWVRGQVKAGDDVTLQSGKPTPIRGTGGRRNQTPGDPELVLAVNRVGVNVNQIARRVNGSRVDTVLVQRVLSQGLGIMKRLDAIYRAQFLAQKQLLEERRERRETDGGGAH